MSELPPGFTRNTGKCPEEAKGKRVVVVLANGEIGGEYPVSAATPSGWKAETTRWTRTGHPFDVKGWRLA